jgi:calreticulin
MKCAIILFAIVASACAEIYFKEEFGAGWEDRWVQSNAKGDDAGKFISSAGKYFNDAEEDAGIKTSEDAKFYGLSAKFDDFSNDGKTLIASFIVKHEQDIDCGGGYVKIFPAGLDQPAMSGDSEYNIMFGPDVCGPSNRKVHVIFNYKGENKLIKKTIQPKTDVNSHLYTLIVNPDQTYEVQIDGEKVESGSFEEDWDFLAAKTIKDPSISKADDWVDEAQMDDPEDTKPEDWVTEQSVADPEAEKPEDWDDEMDGEWEAPMIDNPDFKGEWKAKKIDNPAYKGEWVHAEIANPEYAEDASIYSYPSFGAIGFDLWQVKAGTIFDSVLITDDAEALAAQVAAFKTRSEGEAAAKAAAEEAEAAAKKAEEEAKAAAAAEAEDEDEDEEEAEEEAPAKDEL